MNKILNSRLVFFLKKKKGKKKTKQNKTNMNRQLLRVNTGAADTALFAIGFHNSFWVRRPWAILSDKVRSRFRGIDTQNIGYGRSYSFKYPKNGVLLEDTYLELTLSALTPVGTGTYARFCDYLGYAIVKEIQLNYTQNNLMILRPQHLFMKHLRDYNLNNFEIFDAMVAGNLTASERNTLAAAPQVVKIPLKFFWDQLPCHTPVITALAQELEFKLDVNELANVIQTDYTQGATGTITKARPIYDVLNFTGMDRDQATQPTFTSRGQTFLIEETKSESYITIPAGSQTYSHKFAGFTAPFSSIYFTFQKASDITTVNNKKPFELLASDFALIDKFNLKDGELMIQDIEQEGIEQQEQYQKRHKISKYRKPIGFLSVSEVADIKNQNLGSLNASNLINFTFNIDFKSALPVDYVIYFTFFQHNWINHQAGEIQRAFNL